MSAAQFDDAFFSGVCLNDEPVKTRRNDLVSFGEQKDRWRTTHSRIRNAIKISWDLQCDWTGQQPQVPPAKLTQDHFAQRRWIMQDQSGNFGGAGCSQVQRGRHSDARAE